MALKPKNDTDKKYYCLEDITPVYMSVIFTTVTSYCPSGMFYGPFIHSFSADVRVMVLYGRHFIRRAPFISSLSLLDTVQ